MSVELPPLPEPKGGATHVLGDYSAWQMTTYARSAVDAALEAAAVKAASFATCPCNGASGRCLENDPPNAIAAAIRAMKGRQ